MTFKLKIASPFDSTVGPDSSVAAIMQALAEALAKDVGPASVEDAANLPRGSLEPEYEALGLIDLKAENPGVKLASDFLVEKAGSGAFLRCFDGRFRDFKAGRWARLDKGGLRRKLYAHMGSRSPVFGPPDLEVCRQAISELEVLCHREPTEDAPARAGQILNLRSHELHIAPDGAITLRPHRPWSEQTSVCGYDHDPAATSPQFDKALAEILSASDDPDGMERHLLEILAYGILSWRDIACVVFLSGAGANGKSLLLKIVASLLEADQTMWGSVRRLTGDKFALPDIEGKRLFIEDDAPDNVPIDQGVLKSIAEDKPIMVRRAFATHSTAIRASILPIISSNGVPRFVETSHGFARRLLVIPFRRRFEPEEMDRALASRIIADERPGILNRLIEAHARLRQRGYFDAPEECLRARREMLSTGNGLQAFLDQMTVAKAGARTPVTEVYEGYKRWEAANGGRPVCTRNKLPSKLRAVGFTVKSSVGINCLHDVAFATVSKEAAND